MKTPADVIVMAHLICMPRQLAFVVGVALLTGSDRAVPSAPFSFAWADSDGARTAQLEAWVGVPADSDLSGDGIAWPAHRLELALAGGSMAS